MKKRKSKHKRKKSKLLWIAIAVIGMAAITAVVCVAGMFKKEDMWKTPEELLVEYMNHIPAQEYEQMYAMLHIEASGNVSQEDFIKRNSAIYEGIEIQNMAVKIIAYDEAQLTVTYQTYEMIYASPYPPFGEVVDYTENADGTITLIVDGVWPDYNSDLAFRKTVVVQPFEDGTFRYLSNSIEQIELELPPIAKAH